MKYMYYNVECGRDIDYVVEDVHYPCPYMYLAINEFFKEEVFILTPLYMYMYLL
jgi:hypothetical protein